MPGYDGTGPRGLGEMTGGGRGWCMVEVRQEQTEFYPRHIARGRRAGSHFHCGRHHGNRFRHFAKAFATPVQPDSLATYSPKEDISR